MARPSRAIARICWTPPGKLLAWDPPDHTRPIPAKAYTLDRNRIRQLVISAQDPVPELDPDSAAVLAERDAPD